MAVTKEWNEAVPAGTDNPQSGDDVIRDFKQATRERLRNGGIAIEATAGTDTDAGKIATGVQEANKLSLYENDLTTVMAEFDDSTSELTLGDGIGGSNPWTLVADAVQGKRYSTVAISLPAVGTGRVQGVIYENMGPGALTIEEVRLIAFTAPSGGALEVDINVLGTAYVTPSVTAGASIFGANPLPTIADGDERGSIISTFDDAVIEVNKALVFDIDTLSSADEIVVCMRVSRTQ